MTTPTDPIAKPEINDLILTRVFNAPRELVFKAFTEPEHLMRWWGPKNFTTPVWKMDLRVGGKYLYCMEDNEGHRVWGAGVYQEIIVPEKLVYTDYFADEEGNAIPPSALGMNLEELVMVITLIFEVHGTNQTKLTSVTSGMPSEFNEPSTAGWNESMEKLDEVLKSM